MKVSVFGLGYVGSVTAACLAEAGHVVVGVDLNPEKIDALRNGRSSIVEPALEELIAKGVGEGRLTARARTEEGVAGAEAILICVGTPSRPNGSLDLQALERVATQIGHELRRQSVNPVIVVRSTMLPGTHLRLVELLEQASGGKVGKDFGLCVNPEFLREGSAIRDFRQPPFTLIGEIDKPSGDRAAALYAHLDAPLHRVAPGVAEMVKYASNAFHGLKVAFANEIGAISRGFGADGAQVMELFVQDQRLNLSANYLRPGFAYGGSCLGKDLRALSFAARELDLQAPVLNAVPESNQRHLRRVADLVLMQNRRRVGLIGLSFKSNTDDLRESPAVDLVELLLAKGLEVRIFDHEVNLSKLHGANRSYIEQALPHIGSLLCADLPEVIADSETLVVTKRPSAETLAALLSGVRPGQVLIDLIDVRASLPAGFAGDYHGIAW